MFSEDVFVDKEQFNNGEKFEDGNGISAEVFNTLFENLFFVAKRILGEANG